MTGRRQARFLLVLVSCTTAAVTVACGLAVGLAAGITLGAFSAATLEAD